MNEIMKFFGQQPANGDSFDEIKISIASPEIALLPEIGTTWSCKEETLLFAGT